MEAQKSTTGSTRDRVLDAALTLFTQRGYFNTSVPDIVKASGVSTGSIYHHFKDKSGVANALYDMLLVRMQEAFEEIEARHTSVHDRCRAVVSLLFAMAETEPEAMAFMLYSRHREFIPDRQPVCSSRPFAHMRQMVQVGIDAGEIISGDPVVVAAALFGGPLRLIQLRLDGILERPLPGMLNESWRLAWRGVSVEEG